MSVPPLGDVSAAVVTALHPALVTTALVEGPADVLPAGKKSLHFTWN